jgi:hypothetical protein
MKTIRLKDGKERSLLRRHPWVFDSAIAKGGGDPGETVRVEFSVKLAEAQGKAILDSYGVSDPDDKLSKTFAGIVNESRQRVADSKLKYPADFRILERAAACAPRADRSAVARFLADRLADNVANWNPDTGDLVAESEATVVPWVTKLKSL